MWKIKWGTKKRARITSKKKKHFLLIFLRVFIISGRTFECFFFTAPFPFYIFYIVSAWSKIFAWCLQALRLIFVLGLQEKFCSLSVYVLHLYDVRTLYTYPLKYIHMQRIVYSMVGGYGNGVYIGTNHGCRHCTVQSAAKHIYGTYTTIVNV